MSEDFDKVDDTEIATPRVNRDIINDDIEAIKDIKIPNTKKNRDILRIGREKRVLTPEKKVFVTGKFDFEKCPECDGMDIYIPKANHYYLEHEKLLEKLIKRHEEKVVGKYLVKLSAQIANGLKGVSVLLESFHGGDWVPDILTMERIQGELVEAILMCDSNRYREELEG